MARLPANSPSRKRVLRELTDFLYFGAQLCCLARSPRAAAAPIFAVTFLTFRPDPIGHVDKWMTATWFRGRHVDKSSSIWTAARGHFMQRRGTALRFAFPTYWASPSEPSVLTSCSAAVPTLPNMGKLSHLLAPPPHPHALLKWKNGSVSIQNARTS